MSLDLEQAILRVLVTAIVIVYLAVISNLMDDFSVALAMTYIGTAIAILVMAIRGPEFSPIRRIIGMISDLGGATYILVHFGEVGAPAVFVYFWVTIGNGFRWGIEYLYLAMALSILGMSIVLFFNEYWQANLYLYVGITLSLLIVPLFVSRLLRRLNALIEREQIANQYKSQFLANMSHELRTPLYGVIGTTDLLLASGLNPAQTENVRTINASADTLLSIVNDVLDISKIEAGKYQLREESLALSSLVRDAIQVVAHEASRKGLTLSLWTAPGVPAMIFSDAGAIRQVLLNLLSNAIKFTATGGIRIRVHTVAPPTESRQRCIRIEVADTGIGIAPTVQPEIFGSFTQADESVTRKFGGTGLGMAISKQLVGLLDGEIGVESELSEGSKFWFTIPVNTEVAPHVFGTLRNYRLLMVTPEGDPALEKIRTALADPEKYSVHRIQELGENPAYDKYDVMVATDQITPYLRNVLSSIYPGEARATIDVGLIWIGSNIPPDIRPKTICLVGRSATKQQMLNALAWTARPAPQTFTGIRKQPKHRKILIADDQKSNRSILANILEHSGYETRAVDDGKQTLNALQTEQFDAAIIDYHMPGASGVSIINQYRKVYPESDLRFLILTADATLQAKQECELTGAAYLTKPIRGTLLLQKLDAGA